MISLNRFTAKKCILHILSTYWLERLIVVVDVE